MMPRIVSGLFRKSNRALCKVRLKTGLYHKSALPEYDFSYLQEKWPYVKPDCVRDDFHRAGADGVDLTICVPMYNAETYIEDLLRAIDRQETDYSFEAILVDDGSTDRTAEVVSRYIKDKEHFVLIRQENGGASAARNTAIDHARGEYLCFADSDDPISDDYIQSLMSAAKTNDADIVKGDYCIKRGDTILPMGEAAGFVCGGVYRASLFDRVRFPAGFWFEDMINHFLITPQAKKKLHINHVVFYYVDAEGSASKVQTGARSYKALDHLYLILSLAEDYKKLGLSDRAYLHERLVVECSSLMVERTAGLDEPTRTQAFLACSRLFRKEEVDPARFSGADRVFAEAILNGDYDAWKLAANLC